MRTDITTQHPAPVRCSRQGLKLALLATDKASPDHQIKPPLRSAVAGPKMYRIFQPTFRAILVSALAVALWSCSSGEQRPATTDSVGSSPRPSARLLTREEAAQRKASISGLSYNLTLALEESPSQFSGSVSMRFQYQEQGRPLTIDFSGGEVEKVRVNGKSAPFEYNSYFITLPVGILTTGDNRVDVYFSHPYSKDGGGLYRFVDPVDQRIYLYSDFEPFNASRVFPHFDQPDLKARFSLQVSAPTGWVVVSTSRERSMQEQGDRSYWIFPATAPISSYVFSVHAGQYRVWEDLEFRYPLRLFARHSIAENVTAESWLAYSRLGMDFFEDYFNFSYPFKKYDQLLVPDYNQGAMENVAAVTFSEQFAHRGEMTHHQKTDMVETIYHEMAHMWFGDIATMAWWNGLWLNESFASVMAYLALLDQPEFETAWHTFFLGFKRWAYYEDQLVTTHPIEAPVADTERAETLFDGITYGKGASVLKQLNLFLGADDFRDGVAAYLKANKYANTELGDFTGSLAKASETTLDDWSQRWLYQSGLNRLETRFSCRRGKIHSLQLLQSYPEDYPTLREQQLQLAFYQKREAKLQLDKMLSVRLNNAPTTEVAAAVGLPCPSLVYPNYNDWGYIKVLLDERSVNVVRHHINTFAQPLQQSMIWSDLWQMTRDAKLPIGDYLQILAANLAGVQDTDVARNLLRYLASAVNLLQILPQGDALLERYERVLEPIIWQRIENARGDEQQTWFDAYVSIATTGNSWQNLQQLLSGKLQPAGFNLDQDRRWNIIIKLREYQVSGSAQLLAQEKDRDKSARGEDKALQAQVIGATAQQKQHWLAVATAQDENYQLNHSRNILRSLYPPSQRYLMAPEAPALLARLPEFNTERDILFGRYLSRYLVPQLCNQDNVDRLAAAIADNPAANPAFRRALLIAHQEDERCIKIGELIPDH